MAVLTWPRTFGAWLASIAIFALAVRVAYLVGVHPDVPRLSDATAYHLLANNLADGRGYIRPFDLAAFGRVHQTAEYPPLFPGVLSALSLLGGRGVDAQRVLTCFIGTATVVTVGLLGRKVRGPLVGLVAATLAAVYPMLFQADGVLMAETLFALLVTTALLLAYRAAELPSYTRFVALGAILGLAALTRAEGLVLAAVLIAPLTAGLRAIKSRRRVLLGAVGIATAVLVVVPWTVRNVVVFDEFVPVANNLGTALAGANCPPVYSGPELGLWQSTFATRTNAHAGSRCFSGFATKEVRKRDFNEAAAAARARHDALQYVGDHSGRFPVVAAARVLRTFGLFHVEQQITFETTEGRTRTWQWAGLVMWWLLLPFALAGAVLLIRARQRVWPLLATFVTVTITVVLTYGNQRFRIAAEPAALVLSGVAIVAATDRLRRGTSSGHRDRAGQTVSQTLGSDE